MSHLQEQLRGLVERQRRAVAELPPITWRPRVTNPKPTPKEGQS